MPKFPNPPVVGDLARIPPRVKTLGTGMRVWRIFALGGAHPTAWNEFRAWGPTTSRFDHQPEPASLHATRAILYGAIGNRGAVTAVAEVFQQMRAVDRDEDDRTFVAFDTVRELNLLDLTGAWPTQAGASMAINTGSKIRARKWSRVIYEAYPALDGLYYASSMYANQPCTALYERGADALPASPVLHRLLSDPVMEKPLKDACIELRYALR